MKLIRKQWLLGVLVVLAYVGTAKPAEAGIRQILAGGYMKYDSGFPGGHFDGPIVNPIPAQGFSLYRYDIRPNYGNSRGGALLMFLLSPNRNNYLIYMPPSNFYLSQHQLAQFAGQPAYVQVHFDAHLPIDQFGLPGGWFTIQTPCSVGNDPLPGSFVALLTSFHITATIPGLGDREVGTAVMQASFPFPNQTFTGIIPRPPGPGFVGDTYHPVRVPNLPPNSTLNIWGEIRLLVRGRVTRLGAMAGASMTLANEDGTTVTLANDELNASSDEDPNPDPVVPPDPSTYDPTVEYLPVEPEFIMDMWPFLAFGDYGDDAPPEGDLHMDPATRDEIFGQPDLPIDLWWPSMNTSPKKIDLPAKR